MCCVSADRCPLGVSLDYNTTWRDAAEQAARANVYGLTNLYYDFRGCTTVNVSDTLFAARADRRWPVLAWAAP